ncbi:DUF4245 domain-containing protein [Kitasatospora sp. NPDC096147]|uniref:DUF4245 domain-containing protein n=1 Tax=Kitasatospora sp. NPDC096147 TaxID=3364093 RepID=UPI003804E8AA
MRGRQTVRDMVLSMLAVGFVVFVGYLFIPHSEGDGIKAVDYRSTLASAKRAAPYPVLAPEGLGTDWKPTSVTYDGGAKGSAAWHLGFVTPSGQYASVEQRVAEQEKAVAETVEGAKPDGTATVNGQEWQRYQGKSYRALVVRTGTATTVVTGTASWEELTGFAERLK